MKKNNFKKWVKNSTTKLSMVFLLLLGSIKVAVLGAFAYISGRFILDFVLLLSNELAKKYQYAGFIAPFAAITSILGFIYKHIRENSKNAQEKLVPVLEDLIKLKDTKKLTKDKKVLIKKLEATILLTKQDSIISGYDNYLESNYDNIYLDAIIVLLRHEIRRKTDAYYVFFYYLEILLGRDKIQKLKNKIDKNC